MTRRAALLGLLLATACQPPAPPPPGTPPVERLRVVGSADPTGPVRLVWDAPDRAFGGAYSYRARVEPDAGGPAVHSSQPTVPGIVVPPGTLKAGTVYRAVVEAGEGSPPRWSRPRELRFTAGGDLDGDGVDDRLEAELARTFAPELRFNGRVAGEVSRQNRDEIFFPSSVESFSRWLHSEEVPRVDPATGRPEVVRSATGGSPTVRFRATGRSVALGDLSADDARTTRIRGRPGSEWAEEADGTDLLLVRGPGGKPVTDFDDDAVHIDGVPRHLPGDAPGTAPTYTHVYPIATGQEPDGSRLERYGIEYWVFYPMDHPGELNTDRLGLARVALAIGEHIGDWEHTAFEVARRVDPAGRATADLVRGVFYGHGRSIEAPASRLDLVPGTKHPRAYVGFGKHPSYPVAGRWQDQAPLHDDVFHGTGPVVRTWEVGLVDLGERGAPRPGCEWIRFRGAWGPDANPFGLGSSPSGPAAKGSWGSLKPTHTWDQWTGEPGLDLD